MDILTIIGPTASGKTRLAAELARRLHGAVISVDSRQVFRGMDVGTGKDLHQYGSVPYYLIDIRDAGEPYHLAEFQQDFKKALGEVLESGLRPVLCGGSGLYLQAVLEDFNYTAVPVNEQLRETLRNKDKDELLHLFRSYESEYAAVADTSTRKRLIRAIEIADWLQEHALTESEPGACQSGMAGLHNLIIGIALPVEVRRRRITERLHERFRSGLIDEVRGLLAAGLGEETLIRYGLEYKFITRHLLGQIDYNTMITTLNTAIHRFAKRQMTWFRKMEREGFPVHWIDGCQSLQAQVREVTSKIKDRESKPNSPGPLLP